MLWVQADTIHELLPAFASVVLILVVAVLEVLGWIETEIREGVPDLLGVKMAGDQFWVTVFRAEKLSQVGIILGPLRVKHKFAFRNSHVILSEVFLETLFNLVGFAGSHLPWGYGLTVIWLH